MNQLYDYGFYFIPTKNKIPAIIGEVMMGATHATRNQEAIDIWTKKAELDLSVVGGKTTTGKYLVILDVDIKKEDGEETLHNLEAEYGKLPETLKVITPSGGSHLYFYCDEEIGSSVDAFGKKFDSPSGIDIKGKNGYCQCPPTRGYKIVTNMVPATLPPDWTLLLKSLIGIHRAGKVTFTNPPDVKILTAYNKKNDIRDVLLRHKYVPEGGMWFTHPNGATTRRNVNLVKNTSYTPHGAEYVSFHWGAHDKVKSGPHDAFDIDKILSFGGSHELMVNNCRGVHDDSKWFSVICSASEIVSKMGDELTEYHWRHGDVLTITGDSARYKTFYIIDAAFSLATGLPFLDKFDVRQPAVQSVLFLSESARDFADRRLAWLTEKSKKHGRDKRELMDLIGKNVFVTFKCLPVVGPEAEGLYNAMKPKKNFDPRMLFLDHYSSHFAANHGKDENSNSEAAGFVGALKELVDRESVAVAMIHHPPKAKTSTFRGAGALFNNVPVSYDLKAAKDNPTWTVVEQIKCSYGKGNNPYHIEPMVHDLYMDKTTINTRMRTGLTLTYSDAPVDLTTQVGKGGRLPIIGLDDLCKKIGEGNTVDIKDVSRMFDNPSRTAVETALAKGVAERYLTCDKSRKTHTWTCNYMPDENDVDN
jgi:hypothetical protein